MKSFSWPRRYEPAFARRGEQNAKQEVFPSLQTKTRTTTYTISGVYLPPMTLVIKGASHAKPTR